MIRMMCIAAMALLAAPVSAQSASSAGAGELRVLDKVTGAVTDLSIQVGQTESIGNLRVKLNDCRYPRSNPSGDAFAEITVNYSDLPDPVFAGWLIASAPALNAMEHPRYDVWVLRCIRS